MADTIFARIIRGEIPATRAFEDDEMIAIRDINPAAPTHILVIPKKPIVSVATATSDEAALLGRLLLRAAELARAEGIDAAGYRLVINHGAAGGQSVDHLHIHLVGGRNLGWPPG